VLITGVICGCVGKLCLQNENLAKQNIPALARELEISPDVSVRNNVIIVMCDLCVRFVFFFTSFHSHFFKKEFESPGNFSLFFKILLVNFSLNEHMMMMMFI